MTIAMRVVDTPAWIEWLTGSQLGKRLATQFPDKPQCVVPTIVQLELSKWLMREIGEERADQVLAYILKCAVVPLDTTIALLAADLHREHKRATADAIVSATAQSQQAQLLTCDAQFKNLQDGIFFPKASSGPKPTRRSDWRNFGSPRVSALTAPVDLVQPAIQL